ncbi:tetratricopeptide repeat protein [Streptomyces sp. NPDC007107]|uniref:tetratricopeptide repeat protein n=1 Tax=Streptomyces sp. NPDC007107 TaxID=3156915 RepID=UPI0033D98A2C
MAKTVFTAVLTGAVGHGTGKRALRKLGLPEPHDHLLDDHRFCYPPADRATVLEPLYPDRLAEDFLGLLTPGHDISSDEPDPWANDAPATLTATSAEPTPGVTAEEDLRAVIAPRAVIFLASAAARWAHLGKDVLYPLLRRDPGLAIAAGSSALTTLAALGDPGGPDETGDGALDPDLLAALEAVETLLPQGSDVDLDIGILAVMEVLITHRLTLSGDRLERAELHSTLAARRSNAGRRQEAIAPAQEAVRLCRQLVETDRQGTNDPAPLQRLAIALNGLAEKLSHVGRSEEALFLAAESLTISRRLAQSDPAAHLPTLLSSLTGLSLSLAGHGRAKQAATATQEALSLHRQLAAGLPDAARKGLVSHLGNLSARLLTLGRGEEALTASREVAHLYRELAAEHPAAESPHLAAALVNLAGALHTTDRGEEALTVIKEAVNLCRELAAANPAAHQRALTLALLNLGLILGSAGHGEEALTSVEEAVSLQRELAETDFAAHHLALAEAVQELGNRLWHLGRREQARAPYE